LAGTAADLPAAGVVPGLIVGLMRDKPDAEPSATEVT